MAVKLAIFASGSGTNAEAIIRYAQTDLDAFCVEVVVTNNPEAGVIRRAHQLKVPVLVVDRSRLSGPWIAEEMERWGVERIALAGYLKLIPESLIDRYPDRIVNIHPALLPNFGGQGMYGARVHEAVIASGVKESGITIHLVDQAYDEGKILFQATCPVDVHDSPDSLATKIHRLEHQHYPVFLRDWIKSTS